MPELPEVETIMRGLRAVLEHQTIARAEQTRPDLRRPFPLHLPERLQGRYVKRVRRRAKYILCDLASNSETIGTSDGSTASPAETLLIHLGMSGRISIDAPKNPAPERKHEHFILHAATGHRIGLVDPRRFGQVDLYETQSENENRYFHHMGLEPLDPALFTLGKMTRLFEKRRSPIKTALLDQKLIAGLGNIYVCEALFRTQIHPETPANALTSEALEKLWKVIPKILEEAIEAGGSTLRDYVQADGSKGGFQKLHQVYGREGEHCPVCPEHVKDAIIQRITQGGRSTFFCPKCQALPLQ